MHFATSAVEVVLLTVLRVVEVVMLTVLRVLLRLFLSSWLDFSRRRTSLVSEVLVEVWLCLV